MRVWIAVAALVAAGCGGGDYVPRPTFSMLIPEGREQWKAELASGFKDTLAAYGYETKLISFSAYDPDIVVKAAQQAQRGERAPICVVFTRRAQVKHVVSALKSEGHEVVTVGADDAMVTRTGHVGMSAERMAYVWKIRVSQLEQMPKRVLFVFGSEPIKTERVQGAVFSRSGKGTEFDSRFRETGAVTQEDAEWAELIVPIGEDAFAACTKYLPKPLYPVSGSERVLEAIGTGTVRQAITDEPFQMGVRAAQLVRDYHLNAVRNPIISLPYEEVDAETLQYYRDRRYRLPPMIRTAGREAE